MGVIYPKEKTLFIVSLTLSLIFWIALIAGTFGAALIYVLIFFIFYLFAQSAYISYLRGTAVRITPKQFSDLHQRLQACCTKLGVSNEPEAYLIHGNGVFNAFATRFLGRNFVVLYSDVVDALEASPGAINFYIGHELGHLERKHLLWAPVLLPAGILPLLGAAYSRAREYTCDRYGLACVESSQDAVHGLAALAAGAKRWQKLNKEGYVAQGKESTGFWMSFHELIGDYPWLVKRLAAIDALGSKQEPKQPRRNPFAFLLALFIPRFGIGGGGSSVVVLVAMIGVMAAIAVPAYQDYIIRAGVMDGLRRVEPVKTAVAYYETANRVWPTDLQQIGAASGSGAYGRDVESVQLGQKGMIYVTFARGAAAGKSIAWVPEMQNGQIVWRCVNSDLAPKFAPPSCR